VCYHKVRRVKALFTYEAVVHYIAGFVNEVRILTSQEWDVRTCKVMLVVFRFLSCASRQNT